FCGRHGDDEANNRLLLEKLAGETHRGAHYTCAIVLTRPDGTCVEAEGRFYGEVTRVPAGENGFGYDPLFYLPQGNGAV
ncbi:non-canonical purine NTP pyrophosphatase, partial [Vibrio cholerae]|uniref:non-canonical purine NTP pyrophosphatase n=1 Tax=Vibrio cholerae TaxID=666 RepID=UPI0023DEB6FC